MSLGATGAARAVAWCTSHYDTGCHQTNSGDRFIHPQVRLRPTIRRRLAESNLRAFRPARASQLLSRHRRAILAFVREYAHWTVEKWKNVLFSDESRIALRGPDG